MTAAGRRPALTPRQDEVYRLITAHARLWGVGPGPSLLARRFGVASQTIEDLAVRLYSKGYLAAPRAPYAPVEASTPPVQPLPDSQLLRS